MIMLLITIIIIHLVKIYFLHKMIFILKCPYAVHHCCFNKFSVCAFELGRSCHQRKHLKVTQIWRTIKKQNKKKKTMKFYYHWKELWKFYSNYYHFYDKIFACKRKLYEVVMMIQYMFAPVRRTSCWNYRCVCSSAGRAAQTVLLCSAHASKLLHIRLQLLH